MCDHACFSLAKGGLLNRSGDDTGLLRSCHFLETSTCSFWIGSDLNSAFKIELLVRVVDPLGDGAPILVEVLGSLMQTYEVPCQGQLEAWAEQAGCWWHANCDATLHVES